MPHTYSVDNKNYTVSVNSAAPELGTKNRIFPLIPGQNKEPGIYQASPVQLFLHLMQQASTSENIKVELNWDGDSWGLGSQPVGLADIFLLGKPVRQIF